MIADKIKNARTIKRNGIADLQFLFFFLCKNNKKYTIFSEKSTM